VGWSARTEGAPKLKELQHRIKEAGDSGMRRKFRKEIRQAGGPTVAKLRAAVVGVKVSSLDKPSITRHGRHRGPRSSGLRARVARSIGISQTRKGIRIRASARKVGDYGITLPRYLDAGLTRFKRWRHPVFWRDMNSAPPTRVTQQTGQPWFFVTIRSDYGRFRGAVEQVMEQTKRELER
jgi:hypothetical protein